MKSEVLIPEHFSCLRIPSKLSFVSTETSSAGRKSPMFLCFIVSMPTYPARIQKRGGQYKIRGNLAWLKRPLPPSHIFQVLMAEMLLWKYNQGSCVIQLFLDLALIARNKWDVACFLVHLVAAVIGWCNFQTKQGTP